MKYAMEDDPQKLVGYPSFQVFGVVPNPFYADVDLCGEGFSWLRKRKTEYIGVKVMLQELPVELQKIFVVAENQGESA
jgi:hypothetical protein